MDKAQAQTISAIRVLAAETVQRANSGHPGIALGAAPMAYALWESMTHCPKNPDFFNRDRFVLSAGHGSSLLYSLLHVFGYGVTKEDLMNFRQLRSDTPKSNVPPAWKRPRDRSDRAWRTQSVSRLPKARLPQSTIKTA